MANIKSTKKRVLVTERCTLRNRMVKSRMKTSIKRFEAAVAAGIEADAIVLFREAVSLVDQAASKGVIHKNQCNRKKAQMTKAMASIGA